MTVKLKVPYYKQSKDYTCGPASLKMVFSYFQTFVPEKRLEKILRANPEDGTRNMKLREVAQDHGFYVYVNTNAAIEEIEYFLSRHLPVIVNYIEPKDESYHLAVVTGFNRKDFILNDPWDGKNMKISKREFLKRWKSGEGSKKWLMVISDTDISTGRQYRPHKQ